MGEEDWRARRAADLFGEGRLIAGEPPRVPHARRATDWPTRPEMRIVEPVAAPPANTGAVDEVEPVAAPPSEQQVLPLAAEPVTLPPVSSAAPPPPLATAAVRSPVPPPIAASRSAVPPPPPMALERSVTPPLRPAAAPRQPSVGARPAANGRSWLAIAAFAALIGLLVGALVAVMMPREERRVAARVAQAAVAPPRAASPKPDTAVAASTPEEARAQDRPSPVEAPAIVAPKLVAPKLVAPVAPVAPERPAAVVRRSPSTENDPAPTVKVTPSVKATPAPRVAVVKGPVAPVPVAPTPPARVAPAPVVEARATPSAPRRAPLPSYDCRRNRSAVTDTICGDPKLAALDRRLETRFADLDARIDLKTSQRIHRGETAFLNARQTCGDRDCLIAAYRARLRDLDGDDAVP